MQPLCAVRRCHSTQIQRQGRHGVGDECWTASQCRRHVSIGHVLGVIQREWGRAVSHLISTLSNVKLPDCQARNRTVLATLRVAQSHYSR